MVAKQVQSPAELPTVDDILSVLVAPPKKTTPPNPYLKKMTNWPRPAPNVNYLAIEAANRSLGLAGEKFVMRFETARLISERQERLAAQIEHIAATRGDGAGYDILSFETSGVPRLIEVKTTSYGPQTPFFVTRNELAMSLDREAQYQLYRVYGFRKTPRLFQTKGRIDKQFDLTPQQYVARVS